MFEKNKTAVALVLILVFCIASGCDLFNYKPEDGYTDGTKINPPSREKIIVHVYFEDGTRFMGDGKFISYYTSKDGEHKFSWIEVIDGIVSIEGIDIVSNHINLDPSVLVHYPPLLTVAPSDYHYGTDMRIKITNVSNGVVISEGAGAFFREYRFYDNEDTGPNNYRIEGPVEIRNADGYIAETRQACTLVIYPMSPFAVNGVLSYTQEIIDSQGNTVETAEITIDYDINTGFPFSDALTFDNVYITTDYELITESPLRYKAYRKITLLRHTTPRPSPPPMPVPWTEARYVVIDRDFRIR